MAVTAVCTKPAQDWPCRYSVMEETIGLYHHWDTGYLWMLRQGEGMCSIVQPLVNPPCSNGQFHTHTHTNRSVGHNYAFDSGSKN